MYDYKTERPFVFTEEGQDILLTIRDAAFAMCEKSGACRMQELMRVASRGSTWSMMACVDRLVERGDLIEIIPNRPLMAQYRVFIRRLT